MLEKQEMIDIQISDLLIQVKKMSDSGYRLVQIGCAKLENLEINYSFDKDYSFINFKIILPMDKLELPSISNIYWSAFLYENELSDLFAIKFSNMAIDYKGNFYRTTVKWPFNPKKEENKG